MTTACTCGVAVEPGVNGTVYPPAPWADDAAPQVICYGCENAGELAAGRAAPAASDSGRAARRPRGSGVTMGKKGLLKPS